MIFRTIHDKSNPYFQLNRATVNDDRLSYKAIGIHTYLMSKPDGWEANVSDLVNRHPDGLSAVRSGINELVSFGYIKRVREIDGRGRVTGWTMDVYEMPQVKDSPECENQIVDSPECDFPQVDFPLVENRTLVINKYSEKEEKKVIVANATSNAFLEQTKIGGKEKSKRNKPQRKTQVEGGAPPMLKEPTEHQKTFEKICQIVGWDYKTLGEKEKGQVAQTLGILKDAGYTLDELNRFGKEVWAKDWRWMKHKQFPTLSLLRTEIGKLHQDEKQKAELKSDTDAVSWKNIFENQNLSNYQWGTSS